MTDIPDFPLPKRATDGSAGLDLHAAICHEVRIPAGRTEMIPTGYAWDIPHGWVGLLFPRSGKAAREGMGLANAVGVVDSDYRAEIVAAVTNRTLYEDLVIKPSERFCQLLIVPVSMADVCLVESLSETVRGGGGFGSTGE